MYKWILPTISEVLTLSPSYPGGNLRDLKFGLCEATPVSCASENAVHSAPTNSHARLSADWMSQNCSSNSMPAYSKSQIIKERAKSEREWKVAIRAVENLLLQNTNSNTPALTSNDHLLNQGLVFAGPAPVLSNVALLSNLQSWIFSLETLQPRLGALQLPPAILNSHYVSDTTEFANNSGSLISLLPDDPLCEERFCLILTHQFSLVMALGEDMNGIPAFTFSFEPEVVEQAWKILRARVLLAHSHASIAQLDAAIKQYHPVAPSYQTVMEFSRLLLKNLPEQERLKENVDTSLNLPLSSDQSSRVDETQAKSSSAHVSHLNGGSSRTALTPLHSSPRPDVEFLQAFAHEVRTPLTTIRTLTRLLLKRQDLANDVIKRLKIIDHECTGQIDRMELLFRAAELETAKVKNKSTHLTAMSLAQVLQHSIPRWQQSASRRDLTLDVVLPQHLPAVVSDPKMLDQVLTGLIENFTRTLPAGSHIQVQVIPAGDQLKLQLLHKTQLEKNDELTERFSVPPISKALGQLLIFQPETGNISLNMTATKQLFQSIGGKLIVRQRPLQGEVLTIFLPLEERAHEQKLNSKRKTD